jgi:large subunit ribosomal protein L14e
MIEPGRICVKKSGRDAGKRCVVINVLDKKFVEIVSVKRKTARKCNVLHLIPLSQKVDPKSEDQIKAALAAKE